MIQARSFISNFDGKIPTVQHLRRVMVVLLAAVLFFWCGEGLRYILVNDTTSYTRIMLHEMYTSEKNIDIAFVGSSHAYRSFVPKIMDMGFGAYTFNAGSSSQLLDGSFAMIQEICTYHKPKRIFLELYYNVSTDRYFKKRKGLTSTYILSDYMRPSIRKYLYMLNASSSIHYANSFVPARRNWKRIFDFGYMASVISKKRSSAYKNYRLPRKEGDKEYYVERGFVANDKEVGVDVCWNKWANSEISVTLLEKSDWYKTLLKIITYCKTQGVELTLVVAPLPEWSIVGAYNYQAYYDYVKGIAEENGVEFCDFNLCNPKYFNANDRTLFKDEDHLNIKGAEQFSKVFAQYFAGSISRKDLFYNTLQEKLDSEKPKVFGFAGLSKDGKGHVIPNRTFGIECRLEAIPKEGTPRIIQDYSEEKEFSVPNGEHGKLVLLWRAKGAEGQEEKIEAEY